MDFKSRGSRNVRFRPKADIGKGVYCRFDRVARIVNQKLLLRLVVITVLLVATALSNAAEHGCEASGAGEHATENGAWQIVATDHGFDSPTCVPSGLQHFTFENRGSKTHEVMFIKLPVGMTAKQYLAAVQSGIDFPEGALDYSGPGLTSPGHHADVWLRLDPGNYLLFCWYKDHSSALPAHELKVVDNGSADIALPDVDIVVRQVDFRFEVAGEFRSGPQVIRFETPGPSMHEVDIFRMNDGMDIDDLRRWYKSGRDGPAPVTAFSGVLDNHDIRREVWVKTNLVSGRYVLWCDMPMSTDPAAALTNITHADLGMVHQFTVD